MRPGDAILAAAILAMPARALAAEETLNRVAFRLEYTPPRTVRGCLDREDFAMWVGPLGKSDDGCEAQGTPTTPLPAPSWELVAVACEGVMAQGWGGCAQDEMCVPKSGPGFRQCVFIDGDFSCPTEGYTERHLDLATYPADPLHVEARYGWLLRK